MPATIRAERSPSSSRGRVPPRSAPGDAASAANPINHKTVELKPTKDDLSLVKGAARNPLLRFFPVSKVRQLDCPQQHFEKAAALLLLGDTQFFNGVAAQGTKFEDFTSPTPHAANARGAHDLTAVRALVRNLRPGMARAKKGAIREHNRRRCRVRNIEFGNLDLDFRALDQQFHITQLQSLTCV